MRASVRTGILWRWGVSSLLAASLAGCGGGGSKTTTNVTPHSTGASIATTQQLNQMPVGVTSYGSGQNASIPSSYDLTQTPFIFPPVGDQGQQGSCVAWGTGYDMVTYMVAQDLGWSPTTPDKQASPADLYSKTLIAESLPCQSGTLVQAAMDQLVQQGVQSMSQSPYSDAVCSNPSPTAQFSIKGYHSLNPSDATTIKRFIASGYMIPFAVRVYSDFVAWGESSAATGVYHGNGQFLNEGHCMALVGYDDSKSAWKVMNSWGTGWGNQGFFWMGYDAFAASANAVVVADGGINPSPIPANTLPSFSSLQATGYYDYYYGYSYLIMPFQLTAPMNVLQTTISYQNGTSATISSNVWVQSTYFWLGLAYPNYFPAGTYTLTMQGYSQSGQPVTISQSAYLPQAYIEHQTRASGWHPKSMGDSNQPDGMRPSSFSAGTKMLLNGHPVTAK